MKCMPAGAPDPRSLLTGLGLSAADVEALQRQGFVAAEFRTYQGVRLGPYFKLRWRLHGRQKVKYLGQDAVQAEWVSCALACLQERQTLERQLASLMAATRKGLKQTKKAFEAAMAAKGRYYHGFTSRKRRTAAVEAGASSAGSEA